MVAHLKSLLKNTQFQLICIVVFLLFIPGILLLKVSFDKSELLLTQKTAALIEQSLGQAERNLSGMFYSAQKLSSIASTDSRITETLKYLKKAANPMGSDVYSYSTEMWNTVSKMQSILSSYRNSFFDYQVHTLVIASDGTIFSILDGIGDGIRFNSNFEKSLHKQDWFQDFMVSDNLSDWIMPCFYDDAGNIYQNGTENPKTRCYLVFVRKILDYTTQEQLGISIVSLRCDNLDRSFKAEMGCIMALVNKYGILVHSTKPLDGEFPIAPNLPSVQSNIKSSFLHREIDGITYMVNFLPLKDVGGDLVYLLPQEYVTKEITELRNFTLITCSILFILLLIIGINLILRVTRPIVRMIDHMKDIEIGGHSVGQVRGYSENLSGLEKTFYQMVERIKELVDITLREQQLHSSLQYDALLAQIRPHFLFNTLNSIKWSAMISGAKNVADMIASLGELLEASLMRGEKMITLKRELELVKTYAQIKNWTMKYRFSLHLDIEDGVEICSLIKFSLQPIVENAIIHGIANSSDGKITVRARHCLDDLVIQVIDNGIGIENEKIEEILLLDADNNIQRQKFSGIGLYSINKLTRISYGEKYGISIESMKGSGTTVTLRLPFIPYIASEEDNYVKGIDC